MTKLLTILLLLIPTLSQAREEYWVPFIDNGKRVYTKDSVDKAYNKCINQDPQTTYEGRPATAIECLTQITDVYNPDDPQNPIKKYELFTVLVIN